MRSFIFIASLFRDTRFWSEVGSNALLLLADTTSVIALISHWLLSILCNVVLTCCQHTLSMIDGSYFLCGNGSSSESLVFISRYLSTYLFVSLMFKFFYTVLSGYVCYRKEKKDFMSAAPLNVLYAPWTGHRAAAWSARAVHTWFITPLLRSDDPPPPDKAKHSIAGTLPKRFVPSIRSIDYFFRPLRYLAESVRFPSPIGSPDLFSNNHVYSVLASVCTQVWNGIFTLCWANTIQYF